VVPDGEAKKKKKKKNKVAASFDPAQGDGDDGADVPAPTASASRVVEVVDPSLPKPQTKVELPAAVTKKGKKRDRKDVEEDEAFKDSRGDGPSACRAPSNEQGPGADGQDGRPRRDS